MSDTEGSSKPKCLIDRCGKISYVRGYCSVHYRRLLAHGDPLKTLYVRDDESKRFWIKVNKFGPTPAHRPALQCCWVWLASVNKEGYGEYRLNGKVRKAHRVSYQISCGPIEDGKDLDHLCRNRSCVRPDHLRIVSNKQNCEHRGVASSNTSGYRGISWHKGQRMWTVYASHNGRRYYGGYFADIRDAQVAVVNLRNSLFTHNDLDRIV